MAEVKIASFDYMGVMVQIYAEEDGNGNVVLRIASEGSTTTFDLNGLFIDYGNDGGSVTSVGSKANNMNGADSEDGTKFDGFDAGYELGSIGGKDANYMSGKITLTGVSLEDLQGAEIGLRMQNVASLGGGSLKLGEIAEVPDPGNGPDDHFPEWAQPEISHVTFYFHTGTNPYYSGDDAGIVGTKGANDPDGWFTVKFDVVKDNDGDPTNDVSNDLDDWLAGALAKIAETNPTLDMTSLEGVSIKGGQEEVWYELDNDPNDDDSAEAPSVWTVENKEVDVAGTVDYDGTDYIFTL